jgi:hypothetical protein
MPPFILVQCCLPALNLGRVHSPYVACNAMSCFTAHLNAVSKHTYATRRWMEMETITHRIIHLVRPMAVTGAGSEAPKGYLHGKWLGVASPH